MRANALEKVALAAALIAGGAALGTVAAAAAGYAQGFHARGFAAVKLLSPATARPPLVLAQNPFTPFSLPQTGEPAISPINPGSLPGSTAAIGGSASGTNPITGMPCNGSGSISTSGAGGLPGTTPTPGQISVGVPPTSSIYSSQQNLGAC